MEFIADGRLSARPRAASRRCVQRGRGKTLRGAMESEKQPDCLRVRASVAGGPRVPRQPGGYDPEDLYVYFRFEFDPALIEFVESPPEEWLARFKGDGSITAAQAFGKEWLLQSRSAVLSVPSSAIRIELS